MGGNWKQKKRNHNNESDEQKEEENAKKLKTVDQNSPVIQAFMCYQVELDTRNDKRERLIKLSRDVTIHSKRVIFSLLRKGIDTSALISEAREKVAAILELLQAISTELLTSDKHKFRQAFSPGIQEFIESVSLLHFIEKSQDNMDEEPSEDEDKATSDSNASTSDSTDGATQDTHDTSSPLLTYAIAQHKYFSPYQLVLDPRDYMLGIADLTGELMRMGINAIGNRQRGRAFVILDFMRAIHQSFVPFIGTEREFTQKTNVMMNSVKKVEAACYAVRVRGSEIPQHMLVDMIRNTNTSDDHADTA